MKETDKNRYIWYRGEKLPVTQKDYSDAMRPMWKEAKRRKVRLKRELSLDWLKERGCDIPADEPLVHEIIENKQLLDSLLAALNRLSSKERGLLDSLYRDKKTERAYAEELGISAKTVHSRKKAILKKLRELLSKF